MVRVTTTHDRSSDAVAKRPMRAHAVRQAQSRWAAPTGGFGLTSVVKRIASAMSTPRVPDDYLDLFDPLRAGADLRGKVVSIIPETADAATITIRPGKDWAGHTPGQYIRIGVDIDGVRHWRAYSLTHDARRTDGLISITSKAIPDGLVSNYLVHRAPSDILIHLDQATGDFTLPITPPAKVLFITAGSGLTPVMGMLRNRLADLPDVVHVHLAPTARDVIFANELRSFAASGHLRLIEHHDDESGIFSLDTLDQVVPDWRERRTWVCGPTGLLNASESHWADADLTDNLHVERFRPTLIEGGEGGEITFKASDITIDADGSTPILDAGEDAGVLMPSGCRMGICMGCVVTLHQGAVRDLRTGELTIAEPGDELPIQTCVNAVAGSCDLDL